jgi:hypothetical protein
MGGSGGLQGSDNANLLPTDLYIEPSGSASSKQVEKVPKAYPNIGG